MTARTRSGAKEQAEKLDEEEERRARFGFGSSDPVPRASAFHSARGCLPWFTADDGLKVSVEVIYMRLTFAHVGRSTNARFIESLDSKYKSSIDRVQESRRDNSDDEDEDALFAELEAEIENADSAKLRDKGVKEMQAQFVGFYLFDP